MKTFVFFHSLTVDQRCVVFLYACYGNPDESEIHRPVEDRVEGAVALRPVELVQRLLADREAWHQAVSQQVTEAKQLIGVAMLIDKVFFGPQDRVVVQEPIQHVGGFADRACNDLGMKHTVLIGYMFPPVRPTHTPGRGISASCWPSRRCSGSTSALGGCRAAPWRGCAVGWHVLGGDKVKLPRWCPCRGLHWLGRGLGWEIPGTATERLVGSPERLWCGLYLQAVR